jgi:HEPN domain-containing protein
MIVSDELEEFLASVLPDCDETLANWGGPLRARPLDAANFIVRYCLVEIKNDTKDDYFSKPWFGAIYQAVQRWYIDRYGIAFTGPTATLMSGVVALFATPFHVRVPSVVHEPQQADGTWWICFPNSVLPGESPLDWIERPPNLDSLSVEERSLLTADIVNVATRLREIRVNLDTADHHDTKGRAMACSLIPHLEKAAADILRSEAESRSLAVWELHLACEKAIKIYLQQKTGSFPNVHDLVHLHGLSGTTTAWSEGNSALALLPSGKVAIQHRYAQLRPPSVVEVIAFYRAALTLMTGYTHKLARRVVANNAKLQLRRPPWVQSR